MYDLIETTIDVIMTLLVIILAPILMVAGLVWFAASWGVVLNAFGA
jgi:hypothetical protein